jgi:hypothetical protein
VCDVQKTPPRIRQYSAFWGVDVGSIWGKGPTLHACRVLRNRMMSTTIEEAASVLGVLVRGVRLRVEALDGLIKPHLQRGANN